MNPSLPAPENRGWKTRRGFSGVWFALVCAVFCVVWLRMPCGTFYSPDEGAKYLQIQGMGADPFQPVRLMYPGIRKDPALFYYPARVEFNAWSTHAYPYVNAKGRVQTNWLPWFPWIAMPFFRWLGPRGLTLIPLICGLIAAWMVSTLAGKLAPGARRLALAAFALASPLLFYGLTFWEHTLALVFQLAAVFCVLPPDAEDSARRVSAAVRVPVAAALLLGALALRRETIFFLAAMGLLLVWRNGNGWLRACLRRKAVFAVCTLAAIAVLAAAHPWLLPERTAVDLSSTLRRMADWKLWCGLGPHFFDVFFLRNWGSLLPVPLRWAGQLGLGLCLANAVWPRARHPAGFAAGFLLILPAALFMAFTPIRYRALSSLVLSAPFVLFALLLRPGTERRSAAERFVQTLALLYALFFFVGTWPSYRGHGAPEWGSRYALVLFALLSALGAAHVARWRESFATRGWRKSVLLALVCSALFLGASSMVRGVRELRTTRLDLARIAAVLETRTDPIVTDCWWIGVGMPDLYLKREIFVIVSPEELDGWIDAIGKDESMFRYASYVPLSEEMRQRAARRLEFVDREEICGMEIDTYRVRPDAR